MGIMGFHMLDLSDQFFIFFSWFVFSVDECFNDIAHEQFTSDLTTKTDHIRVQFFFGIKSSCHIAYQSRTDTRYFVNSIVDPNTSTTDTNTKICLATCYGFTNFFTKNWIVGTCMVISPKVEHFISF